MHEACCNLLDCTNQLQRTAGFDVQERMLYFVKHTTYEYLHGLWPESFTICYHAMEPSETTSECFHWERTGSAERDDVTLY